MPQADAAAVERALRSFASAAIALAAHELNNRLAVMRETLGLMDDLARAGKTAAAGTARAQAALDDQVGRALNIVRALSGLGGALGSGAGGFDAGAAVGDLLGLTDRWARQRNLRIGRETADKLPPAAGDPALFLCLAHRLLTAAGDRLPSGGEIAVSLGREGAGIGVSLRVAGRHSGAAPSPDADEEINRELARRLGGELLFEGDGASRIVLSAAR